MKRLGVVGIVVEDRDVVPEVQKVLSENSEIILGRMGLPDRDSGFSAISVVVKGSVEEISALTGKLGKIKNVFVKSALTSVDIN
ncbi:MAG: TM1266 family iron-only hydrogenase system putative regulator [Eubacteriales bacterium]|nr:TM1266 family iron-only hydrogenase system putative regulator [Eubacteriales bacterium]